MKKLKLSLPISIIIGFLIIGLFYYLAESEKQECSNNQHGQNNQAEIFSKKIECGKLIPLIKQEIIKEDNERELSIVTKLIEVFYSEKENSCLYEVEYYDPEMMAGPYLINLKNALTNRTVKSFMIGLPGFFDYYNVDGSRNNETWDELNALRDEINEYK